MKAIVRVTLKEEVNDTHGAAVKASLRMSGFSQVERVRYGRLFHIDLEDQDPAKAKALVSDMCEKLLANKLIEDYEVEIK